MTETITKEEVLEKLYRERPKAIRKAKDILGDIGMAEDVVQDAYIKVIRNLDRLYWSDVVGYFFLAVHHCAINEYRMRKRRSFASHEDIDEHTDIADTDKPEIPQELTEHINHLQPKYRLPIILQYILGYQQDEVAAIMGIPIGTVKSRNFRGLEILKEKLLCEKQAKHN